MNRYHFTKHPRAFAAWQAHLLAGEGHPEGVCQTVCGEPPSAVPGAGRHPSAPGRGGPAAGRGVEAAVLH